MKLFVSKISKIKYKKWITLMKEEILHQSESEQKIRWS